jgi:hypothetical protein
MMQPQISTTGTNILYCISRPTYAAASSLSSAARDPATNLEPHNAGFYINMAHQTIYSSERH